MTSTAPVRCKCKKQAITGLRCSRCFVPICPDCSRPAPVGMLCSSCARGKPSHLYQIEPKAFAIALPVTLIVAVFGGWLLATIGRMGFFGAFAAFLFGIAVGEVALRLTGRKRGLTMELMAGSCVLIGVAAGYAIHFMVLGITARAGAPDDAAATSVYLMSNFLLDPWLYVSVAVAIFGAVTRVRNI